jgi:hypothetical protein
MTLKVAHIRCLSLQVGKTVTRCAGRKFPLSFGVSRRLLVVGAEVVAHGQVPNLFFAAGRANVDVELAGTLSGLSEKVKVRRIRIRCKQIAEALKPWNEGTKVSNILDGDLDINDGFGIQTRDGGGADVIDPKNDSA